MAFADNSNLFQTVDKELVNKAVSRSPKAIISFPVGLSIRHHQAQRAPNRIIGGCKKVSHKVAANLVIQLIEP